ncbi:MAG: T9SS type A sorting domain-containing protein, partial [Cytophagaceae bacterium]|nr:T9SS type A sorting domain-containing protein [Cytophagaceae bacterium]
SGIAGTTTLTQSTTGNGFSVTNVAGVTYSWSYSGTGGTINGTGNAITLDLNGSATGGTLSVTANSGCGGPSTASSVTITVNTATVPQPGAFTTSTATICPPQGSVTYTVPNAGGTTYNWSYTGTGFSIVSGAGTNSIVAAFAAGATSGTLEVRAQVGANISTPRTLALTMGSAPTSAGAIGGTFTVTQGQSGVAYSVTNVAGTTYNWLYSGTGATISGGTGSSITISYSTSATSGNLSVTATNGCGTSPASTQAITVTPTGSTPQPGAFTASSATVCQGVSGVTYTVPNAAVTSYTWSYSGTGATINGITSSITIDFSMTATSGTLSVVANNGSGNSVPRTQAITVNAMASQPGSISGSNTATQGQNNVAYFVLAQSGVTFNWTYNGTGVTFVTGQGNNAVTVNYSSTATSGDIEVTASSASCPSTSLPTPLTISVSPSTGIEDGLDLNAYGLKVYPNPAASDVTVEINVKNVGSKLNLSLIDVLGNEVRVLLDNASVISDTYTFSLEGLAYGVYFVRAKSGDDIKTIKLIKY